MKPSYNDETLAAYFQPLSRALYEDPIVGAVLRTLENSDPDVLAAVAEVDRSQIRDALALSPEHRVRQAFGLASTLEGYRRV